MGELLVLGMLVTGWGLLQLLVVPRLHGRYEAVDPSRPAEHWVTERVPFRLESIVMGLLWLGLGLGLIVAALLGLGG